MPRPADDLDAVMRGTPRPDRVAADWRETILAKVDAKARVHRNQHGRIRDAKLTLNVGLMFAKSLGQAAQARGISRVGYLRRAVAAFIAADLEIPFTQVVSDCPLPSPYTPERSWSTARGDDDGRGYGTWVVASGQTEPAGPPGEA